MAFFRSLVPAANTKRLFTVMSLCGLAATSAFVLRASRVPDLGRPEPSYMQEAYYNNALALGFLLAAFIALGASRVRSPYGRFGGHGGVWNVNPRLGWFLMEFPATLSFVFFYLQGEHRFDAVPLCLLGVWLLHYGNRGFVFPLLMRVPKEAAATFGVTVIVAGWIVTSLHGYLNAVFISHLGHYPLAWFRDPRFVIGISLYAISFVLNVRSDSTLRNLRSSREVREGTKRYRIPTGGLFRWITNPSYLTEILGFTGFAIATWSLGSVFIVLVTVANLVPRAHAIHGWYKSRFAEYPVSRKILIPFVW